VNIKECLALYNRCSGLDIKPKDDDAKKVVAEVRTCIKAATVHEAVDALTNFSVEDGDELAEYDALEAWHGEWKKPLLPINMVKKMRRLHSESNA